MAYFSITSHAWDDETVSSEVIAQIWRREGVLGAGVLKGSIHIYLLKTLLQMSFHTSRLFNYFSISFDCYFKQMYAKLSNYPFDLPGHFVTKLLYYQTSMNRAQPT